MDLAHLFPKRALGKSGEVWETPGSGKVRGGLGRSGEVWETWTGPGKPRELWAGPGRSGEVLGGLGKCWEVPRKTVKSVKSVNKNTQHIVFYSILAGFVTLCKVFL